MEYCLVKDGVIKEGPVPLPKSWGNVTGLHVASPAKLTELGWLKVIMVPPVFDKATHKLGARSTSIGTNDVTFTWTITPLTVSDVYENWKLEMAQFEMSREMEEHIKDHHSGITDNAYTQALYDAKIAKRAEMAPKPVESK